MKSEVFIRTDANAQIGLGHFTRCLALAQMLHENFNVRFFMDSPSKDILRQLKEEGFACENINDDKYFLQILTGQEIVVLDGYHFDTVYQKKVKSKGNILVCIDDLHDKHFMADIIINHAPGLTSSIYSKEYYTKLLLGPNYALLRKEFLTAASELHHIDQINKVFVCFGGVDLRNLTLYILHLLKNVENISKINVVIGSVYGYEDQLKGYIKNSKKDIKLFKDLNAKQMVECMLKSDLAIVPASGILFEVVTVKMPVISGYYTENQIDIYRGFLNNKVIKGLDKFKSEVAFYNRLKDISKNGIQEIVSKQNGFIDGKSSSRIINEFKALNNVCSNIS